MLNRRKSRIQVLNQRRRAKAHSDGLGEEEAEHEDGQLEEYWDI